MSEPSQSSQSSNPLSDIIDFTLDEPNVLGTPLWLLPRTAAFTESTAVEVAALHARERASSTLEGYARTVLGLAPALHHRLICEAVTSMLRDDDCDDLIICIPPGGAKTTYASFGAASWFMGHSPHKSAILATHTAELSEDISRRVRDAVSSDEHQIVFPRSQIAPDSRSVGRWTTTRGGKFLAVGVGASILGFRADVAYIDDPVSGYEQAQSDTQLKKIHNWFETDLITRLKPGGKIILVCQRLSPNDMAGYMIARNALTKTRRQKIVKLRMEAIDGEVDPLGRAPGERLWPEWFTQAMVDDAKRDDYKWRTLYQQEPPSSSGEWVGPSSIVVHDPHDPAVPDVRTLAPYVLTDLALSINKGDYSVHIVVGVDATGLVWVLEGWRGRTSVEVTVDRHIALCAEYGPRESLIDDDNAAKVYVQLLATRSREQGVSVPWRTMPMRGQDKETRAAALRGMFRSGRIRFVKGDYLQWLTNELLLFPNAIGNGVDDGVDALSLIGRRLASLSRAAPTIVKVPYRPKTWQDVTLDELHSDRAHSLSSYGRINRF